MGLKPEVSNRLEVHKVRRIRQAKTALRIAAGIESGHILDDSYLGSLQLYINSFRDRKQRLGDPIVTRIPQSQSDEL